MMFIISTVPMIMMRLLERCGVEMIVTYRLILHVDLLIIWHELVSLPERVLGVDGATVVRV